MSSKLVQKSSDVVVDAVFQLPSVVVSAFRRRKIWTPTTLLWNTIEADMKNSVDWIRLVLEKREPVVDLDNQNSNDTSFVLVRHDCVLGAPWVPFCRAALDQYPHVKLKSYDFRYPHVELKSYDFRYRLLRTGLT